MIESKIEEAHCYNVRNYGGVCLKGEFAGTAAWPDRLVLKPDGEFYWVEFKVPGNDLQPDQVEMVANLKRKGHVVYVCDNHIDSSKILDAEFVS